MERMRMLELSVSWSEIDKARQCPKAHQVFYLDRWSEPGESPALRRGNVWHRIMETWYNSLLTQGDPDLGVKRIERMLADDPERDLFLWMLDGYVRQWGLDAGWRILGIEVGDEVAFPVPAGSAGLVDWAGRPVAVWLKLKLDLLVETAGFNGARRLFVVDHKSGGTLPGAKALEFEDQFGLYIWAMRQAGRPVYGAIYNAALAKMNKTEGKKPKALEDRFSREDTVRTGSELDEIARDAYETVRGVWQPYLLQGSDWRAPRIPNGDTCRYRCSLTNTCMSGRQLGWEAEKVMMVGLGMKPGTYTNLREVSDAEDLGGDDRGV